MSHKWVVVGALCAVFGYTAPSRAGGYDLAFSDEFNNQTELDRNKWATRYVYSDGTLDQLNDEEQHYEDNDNHVVSAGALALKAKALGNRVYSSGMIRSRQTFYYGYFETRVYLPNALGVWPAFWLNSDYDADGRLSWPPEIDGFEYVLNGTTEKADMIHSGVVVRGELARGGSFLYRNPGFNQQWTFFKAAAALNTGWQVVGLLWKPDSVSMYLNGEKIYTRAYKWLDDRGGTAGPAHIILNLAIGGSWAGLNGVEDGKFPQSLKVDYVRACRDSATSTNQLCAGSLYSPLASEAAYSTPLADLKRTRLVSAQISNPRRSPGSTVTVGYAFDASPTPSDHQVRTTLINAHGAQVYMAAMSPPVPTSKWNGVQRMNHYFVLPKTLPLGNYRVLVSVGSPDATAAAGERRISLTADGSFGTADGKLRYAVGTLNVVAP
jgi:beta-glucanase (GH16 family)